MYVISFRLLVCGFCFVVTAATASTATAVVAVGYLKTTNRDSARTTKIPNRIFDSLLLVLVFFFIVATNYNYNLVKIVNAIEVHKRN